MRSHLGLCDPNGYTIHPGYLITADIRWVDIFVQVGVLRHGRVPEDLLRRQLRTRRSAGATALTVKRPAIPLEPTLLL